MNNLILDKNEIKRSFSRAASTYDSYSKLQKDTAEDLLKLEDKIQFSSLNTSAHPVLEIGCGTGILSSCFKKKYPHLTLLGCDFSLPMLFKAKEKLQGKSERLLTSDLDHLPFKNSLFNLAISNLTYQWAPDIYSALLEVRRVLKPDGLFLFSTLGHQTLKELRISYKKTEDSVGKNMHTSFINFQKTESLSSNLKKVGFEIFTMKSILKSKYYKNLWDLLRTLKFTGASPLLPNGKKNLARGITLKETAKFYQKNFATECGSNIFATYNVIFVAAKKL